MQAVAEIDMQNFRENVDYLCADRGAKVRLAKGAEITPEYLSEILSGRKSPSLHIAYDIATFLGVGLDDLKLPHKKFLRIFKKAS